MLEFCRLTCTIHQGPNPEVKPLSAALCGPSQLQEHRDLWKAEKGSKKSSGTDLEAKDKYYMLNKQTENWKSSYKPSFISFL